MLFNNKIKTLKNIINNSEKIVFFGGAGVSTESGIPDFRSNVSLFKTIYGAELRPMDVLKRSFFVRHPEDFYKFYLSKMIHQNAKPNKAHKSLFELHKLGKLSAIITQNIDGLHHFNDDEYNSNVFELHGSVLNNYCVDCCKHYSLKYILEYNKYIPLCESCNGIIKPDVVLYEENLDPFTVHGAINKIKMADTLIVGGTSLLVQPAANLIKNFTGGNLVIINKGETPFDKYANLLINDFVGDVLSKAIE